MAWGELFVLNDNITLFILVNSVKSSNAVQLENDVLVEILWSDTFWFALSLFLVVFLKHGQILILCHSSSRLDDQINSKDWVSV